MTNPPGTDIAINRCGAKMIIIAAIILQITAAFLALRQMGGKSAYGWAFIAVPLLFMGTVKAVDLAGYSTGINMEILSLLVGGSMYLGLLFISRIFRSYQQNLNLFKSITNY